MTPYQEENGTSHGHPFLKFHITRRSEVVVEEIAWNTLESITWPPCFSRNNVKPDGAFYIDANSLPLSPPLLEVRSPPFLNGEGAWHLSPPSQSMTLALLFLRSGGVWPTPPPSHLQAGRWEDGDVITPFSCGAVEECGHCQHHVRL